MYSKYFLFLGILVSSIAILAIGNTQPKPSKCNAEIQAFVKQALDIDQVTIQDLDTFITHKTSSSQLHLRWDPISCQPELQIRQNANSAQPSRNLRLLQIEKESCKKNILVYSWSPQMPISAAGFIEAQKFARQNKIKLYQVQDPMTRDLTNPPTPVKLRSLAGKKANTGPEEIFIENDSELDQEGIRNHYPSFFFLSECTRKPVTFGFRTASAIKEEWQKAQRQ